MKTINPTHLGDGAYVGGDPNLDQIWLGANHHEHMTVALGYGEFANLARYALNRWPHAIDDLNESSRESRFAWGEGDLDVD